MEKKFSNGRVLRLVQGDITKITADAIANAANAQLRGGGGVDGAIHRSGGPAIMAELDLIRASQGGCPTGSAVATGAGNLPAKYVYHAVGPVYHDGRHGEDRMLASCYETCLKLADEHGVRTITFPSISTGVYGYPLDEAAPLAIAAVSAHLNRAKTSVEEATFVLFDKTTLAEYEKALAESGKGAT